MAIALDSSGSWDSSHSSPVAGSVAVGAGLSNSILVVVLSDFEFGGDPAEIVSGVSSDQDGAFTQVNSNVNMDNANAQMWYILSPTTATHSITITYGVSTTSSPTSAMWHLWTGVHQTTPFGTPNSATGKSTNPSVTVTTASGEVVIDIVSHQPSSGDTAGADQTEIQNNSATDGNSIAGATSQQAGADGGTMSWTINVSNDWAILAAPLKPAAQDFTLTADSGSVTVSGLAATLFTGTAPLQAIRDFVLKIG